MTITDIQAAHALQTCVVAIIGVTVLFKILPMYRLDCFRQKMFAARDELFDYATNGKIAFDDPAYVLLRLQMNGMIRYGHQLTLFRAMVTSVGRKVSGNQQTLSWHESWEKALANLNSDDVRARMASFHDRSTSIAAKHLISGSIVLWFALIVVTLYLLARGAALGVRELTRVASNKILAGPIDQRFLEEDAVIAMA